MIFLFQGKTQKKARANPTKIIIECAKFRPGIPNISAKGLSIISGNKAPRKRAQEQAKMR